MSAERTITIVTEATLVYTSKPFPWVATITARVVDEGISNTRSNFYSWRWTALLSIKRIQRSMRRELRRTVEGKNTSVTTKTTRAMPRKP